MKQNFDISVGDNREYVTVPLNYDTMSWIDGNKDGQTKCGTNSPEGVDVTFTDSAGTAVTLSSTVYTWESPNLIVEATDNAQEGTHSVTMHIKVANQPTSEARTWTFTAEVTAVWPTTQVLSISAEAYVGKVTQVNL